MSLSFADLVIILNDDNDGEIRGRRDPSLCRAVSGPRDSTVIHAGLPHGGHQPRGALPCRRLPFSGLFLHNEHLVYSRQNLDQNMWSSKNVTLLGNQIPLQPYEPADAPPGLPVLQRRLFRPLMRASATYIPWYLFQPRTLKHNQPSQPAQAHSPAEIRSSRTSLLPRQPPTYLFPCHTQHGTIRHVSLRVRPGFQHFGIVSSWVCFFVLSCPE